MSLLARICAGLAILNLAGFMVFLELRPPATEYIAQEERELAAGEFWNSTSDPILIGERAFYGWDEFCGADTGAAQLYFMVNLPALIVADWVAHSGWFARPSQATNLTSWISWVLAIAFAVAVPIQWSRPLAVRSTIRFLKRRRQARERPAVE